MNKDDEKKLFSDVTDNIGDLDVSSFIAVELLRIRKALETQNEHLDSLIGVLDPLRFDRDV
jgi:hypothetical protein